MHKLTTASFQPYEAESEAVSGRNFGPVLKWRHLPCCCPLHDAQRLVELADKVASMHVVARHSFRAASHRTVEPCRFVAGRRRLPQRNFQTWHSLRDPHSNSSSNTQEAALNYVKDLPDQETLESAKEQQASPPDAPNPPDGSENAPLTPEDFLAKAKGLENYGSWSKRALRNSRKISEFQLPTIPPWFLSRNVQLYESPQDDTQQVEIVNGYEEHGQGGTDAIEGKEEESIQKQLSEDALKKRQGHHESNLRGNGVGETKYKVDKHIYDEIRALVLSGLHTAGSPRPEDLSISKPHVVLQSPKAGATQYLTVLAETIAHRSSADVVKVDAQDIAELAGSIVVDSPEKEDRANPIRSLGYEVHIVDSDIEGSSAEDDEVGEEGLEDSEDDNPFSKAFPSVGSSRPSKASSGTWKSGSNVSSFLKPFNFVIPVLTGSTSLSKAELQSGSKEPSASPKEKPSGDSPPATNEFPEAVQSRLLFDAFLDSPKIKRYAERLSSRGAGVAGQSEKDKFLPNSDLVIILQDYLELQTSRNGGAVLDRLHDAVRQRRKEGQRVVVIGISTAEDLVPSASKSGFQKIQTEARQGPYRIVIATLQNKDVECIFKEDEKARISHVNVRHLQDMVRRLAPKASQIGNLVAQKTSEITFDTAKSFSWGLEDAVWSMDRIHRVASIALGLVGPEEKMDSSHLSSALETIRESDQRKFEWLDQENERQSKDAIPDSSRTVEELKAEQEERMKKLRKTCSTHERKLLNGVIDSSTLKTTFADVRAPPSSIEALKTLTSLSLIRPDAFTYGVLATDKIPGLLLYGPPGTGKTLLAKAVAKESGATVLEVSGSDIYDMYVGEGEKNVRALFTLARKLSPCVVFIDEADAIFGSRNSSGNRTSHRELINQFLREWDGMASAKAAAFIMVATNRPFDLDDAVLRRLPRRLLVDLPTRDDREAILKIHLQNEVLDKNVSLADLAERTPFYSGSDLKNLCVAAALACVKAENEAAATATSKQQHQPYTIPPRRTLQPSHFEKALSEISASISEDMTSLAAIRKFDEKYGDRKGRRRGKGMGFGTSTTAGDKEAQIERERKAERDLEEEVRVRR